MPPTRSTQSANFPSQSPRFLDGPLPMPGIAPSERNAIGATVAEYVRDGVLVADLRRPDMPLVHVNRAFQEITGYSAEEAIGRNCRYLQGNETRQPGVVRMREALQKRQPLSVSLRNYRRDGSLFCNELRLVPLYDRHGEATHYVGIMRDVTQLKESDLRLERAATLDRLTSIANRYSFHDQLESLLCSSKPPRLLVAKIDVARFHEINTSFGYEVGDALLIQVAERLASLPGGPVARVGSNEFAIATVLLDSQDWKPIIARLRQVLGEKFVLPGTTMDVRFAIGFIVAESGADAKTLLRQAGVALSQSKASRPHEARQFDSATDLDIKARVRLTRDLQQAVSNGDFLLAYQPKIDLATGAIVGAEALIRWRHPALGLQSPAQFIPIAEETGLILDIGAWALRTAAEFASRINRDSAAPLTVAVNVSQMQFTHQDMVQLVKNVLDDSGAAPSWLMLELTESLFAESSPEMIGIFQQLRAMGLGFSIDDFGTGYSSLRYLEKFPLSEIKIDQSFIRDVHRSEVKRVIVDAVIKIGKELQVAVTAEGVETEAERAMLRDCHCPYGQGFLFGRPMADKAFLRLI